MRKGPSILFLSQCACLIGSCILLAKPVYHWGKRELSHRQADGLWQRTLSSPSGDIVSGDPLLWLRIPDCKIDELVLYQDTLENLHRHPCLAQENPSVILGHRDTHFRKLQHIQLEDRFEVEHRDGRLQSYRVSEIEILPAGELSKRIHEHRDTQSLILVSCYPFTFVGPAPERFIVWAHPG